MQACSFVNDRIGRAAIEPEAARLPIQGSSAADNIAATATEDGLSMEPVLLETVERETGPKPTASIIWLHGLGADAHDFYPVVPMLDLGSGRPVRYVFP